MKVVVFGNIATGKTTLLSKISKVFSFDQIAIDDFRRKFGDGSDDAELIARANFLEAIVNDRNQLIECLGVGKVADQLFDLLCKSNEVIICIILNTPKEICIERLADRTWDVPFPKPLEVVFDLIERTENRILAKEIQYKWNRRKNTIVIQKDNIESNDIDLIISDITPLIQQNLLFQFQPQADIASMLSEDIQRYYGNEYHTYQNDIINRDKFLADRLMVEQFLLEENLSGNVVDIGAGNCQWFPLLEPTINQYFAVEVNDIALSLSPKSEKIHRINKNIFLECFNLKTETNSEITTALFSFFLSHFSNNSISLALKKLSHVNSIIIIDSLWGNAHEERYFKKDLNLVKRQISKNDVITLPKRFFEYSDIDNLTKPFGFSIVRFFEGNYWFACSLKRTS